MAEPLRKTDDIPAYDTYPAPEGTAAAANLERPGEGAGYDPRRRRSLGEAADQISETVVRARELARELPQRMEGVRQRFEVIRGRAADESSRQLRHARDYAGRALRDAGQRADRLRRERPLQVLGGAAIAAFALGALLRIRRSRNA